MEWGPEARHARGMKRLAVYCGSRDGRLPAYAEAAEALGRACAARGIGVVYGGARIGLMGRVADAALAAGGEVIGVIPASLMDREVAHEAASELVVVDSLHARKAVMTDRCDAVVAIPGGHGTLDELFESLTWQHLGEHDKPVAVWDVGGYWAPLLEALAHMEREGFVRASQQPLVARSLDEVFRVLGLG
jgi:uncharacterized protein (TIGR00730 family)